MVIVCPNQNNLERGARGVYPYNRLHESNRSNGLNSLNGLNCLRSEAIFLS